MTLKNENQPLISVIIPVFNGSQFISQTIDSVFKQTYTNIEIIIVDDGSTDNSVSLVKSLSKDIKIVEQNNKGAAAARNSGVDESKGEFIAFLDSDDIWHPQKLEIQIDALRGCEWCYTDTLFLGGINDGISDSFFTKKYEGFILDKIVTGNFIGTSTVLLSRNLFNLAGGFNSSLRSIEDWEFWCRVSSFSEIRYIPQSLVKYRVHPSSVSRSARGNIENHMKVIDLIFDFNGPGFDFSHLKGDAKYNSFNISACIAEEERDFYFALKCRLSALQSTPLRYHSWTNAIKSFVKLFFRRG